jgi:putative transposase
VQLDQRLGPLRTKESLRKLTRLLERDPNARVLRATVQRSGTGWVISFSVERSPKARRAHHPDSAVGVDLGLTRLATLSTGLAAPNSRPLRATLSRLRRFHRQLDRQRRVNSPDNYYSDGRVTPGRKAWVRSARMGRTEHRLRRLHARVANLRREQAHQLTTYLTREFGVIGVETLQVRNLLQNRRLARHIADAGWGTILSQLVYKTSWSDGSLLVAADRFYPSSKTCSACGHAKAKLAMSERVFACPTCGQQTDRDLNAALNLARMAQQHAQAQGLQCHVAATEAETLNARRGQVRLDPVEHSPMKREDSTPESPQPGNGLALAA